MKLKITLVASILILLQGCAVSQRTLLSPAERNNIKQLNLYNLIIQDEVKPSIELSNVTGAMGGGLIPALIDSSINKGRSTTAQDVAEPLYLATESVDYRKLLAKEVNASVSSVFTLKAKKDMAEAKLLSDPELKEKISQLVKGEYLLYTSSFYAMMEGSKSFNAETVAMVFKKSAEKSSDRPKPVYTNHLSYVSDAQGNGEADSIALWSKNNGELFVKMLGESAREIAAQLKYDLQNTVEFECGAIVTADTFGFNGVKMPTKLIMVEQKPARAIVRNTASGFLYSVPGTPKPTADKNQKCKN